MTDKDLADELSAEEQAAFAAMEQDTGDTEPEEEAKAETPEELGIGQANEPKAEEKPDEPEGEDKPKADKPPEGYVPHGALHAERTKRQELEQRVQQFEQFMQAPEVRKALEALQQGQKEPEPEMPDPVTDPEGYRKWYEAERERLQEPIRRMEQEQRRQAMEQQVRSFTERAEAEFVKQKPDYEEALDHFLGAARANIDVFYPHLSEQQRVMMLEQGKRELAANAARAGQNPAEMIYNTALRIGYQPKAQQPAQQDEAKRLQALAEAQKQTESLAGAANDAGAGGLTAESLARMSEEEIAKLSEDDIRKVMGG